MLEKKLNSLFRIQCFIALVSSVLFWATGQPDMAVAVAYVSALLLANGLSLGAGIVLSAEVSPLKGLRVLYVRAAIRFLLSTGFLVVGFYYLKLNIFGVLFAAALYYAVPLFEMGKEAVMLKREAAKKHSIISKVGDADVGS